MTDETAAVRVGQIIKPHGVEGELVVEPYTEFPEERYRDGATLLLFDADGEVLTVSVKNSRWHQDRLLVELEEVTDRDRAEELRDCWLGIPEDQLEEGEEAVYGHQLLDLSVRDQDGKDRGVISAIHPDPLNPLAEIKNEDDVLDFPLSEDLVLDLDLDEGVIVLRFPEGWAKLKRN